MKFNQTYKRETFENLLSSTLFGDKYKREYKSINIDVKTLFFDDKNCFILGKVNLDRDIYILEMKQKSKKDPRITLTKDAFKIMENIGANYALVIFYSDDSKSYRLSLLTRKKVWGEKEESDPKRYSFLLGEGEKTKTPEKQLNKQINNFNELFEAFDVEVVRKEFFNNYLDLYIRLYREIIKDIDFTKLLKSQGVDLVSFTKTLLGKIVFLYFIQKKGWLGVKRGGDYGIDGDKDFMRSIWNDFKNNSESLTIEKKGYFYNDYLEWLFYEGLNKDRRDNEDYFVNLQMKVPYLNGGLFKEDYKDWEKNVSKISNDIFSNTEKTGILDIFDTYNFTVDEDDLYDKEVAIDPEMLGKIFEKMISISSENIDTILEEYNKNESSGKKKKLEIDNVLNKKLGAFYTPREIVHYMTKESLIAYLVNNLKGKKEENEEKVRQLFDFKEQFLITKGEITEKIFDELAGIIEDVDNLLQKVKVLDPAIGSGAFPMGLLHEISSIRYYIYGVFYETFGKNTQDFKNESGKVSMYKIKRDVIQNNIYGVDISAGAIDIARLRFWLSLVVDEEIPEPLPNFEFKFVCANTLIPLEEEQEQKQLEFQVSKEINIETLRKYMSSYYNAQSNKDKEDWKTRIEKFLGIGKNTVLDLYKTKSSRTKQLETYEPFNANHSAEFFDPSLMMGNGKFDIVISNPPYIKERDNAKVFDPVNNSKFGKKYHQGKMDFWYYFLHLSMDVLKNNGYIIFITNSYWTKSAGSSKLINRISNEMTFDKIIDFGDLSIFQDVNGKHMIHSYIKKQVSGLDKTLFIENSEINIKNQKGILLNSNSLIKSDKIYYSSNNIFGKIDSGIIDDFFIVSQGVVEAPDKISTKISNDNRLFKKGDGVFVLNKNEINSKNFSLEEQNILKKYLNTNNIYKYGIKHNKEYLIYTDVNNKSNIENGFFHNIKNHLDYYSSIISSSNGPYGIHRTRKKEYFENEKLICKGMFKSPEFTYDNEGFYVGMSFSVIINKEKSLYNLKFLLSILNSKLGGYWFNHNGKKRGVGVDIGVDVFRQFPIPKISPEAQKPFIEKVDKISEITKQAFYDPKNPPKEQKDLENEIDKMVYELYGLSDDEVRVVEGSLEK